MWKLPNGSIINAPRNIRVDDVNYPKTIFTKWSVPELNAIGIYPFSEKRVDTRYYKSTGFTDNVIDGAIIREHTTTPRYTLNQLKKTFGDEMRQHGKSAVNRLREEIRYFDEIYPNDPERDEWVAYAAALKTGLLAIRDEVIAIDDYEVLVSYIKDGTFRQHLPAPPGEEVI